MRNSKLSLSKIFLLSMVFTTAFSILITGHFLVSSVYSRFREESKMLRRDYLESQKSLVKNQIEGVIDYIEYRRSKTDDRLKQMIRQRVYEAHGIASNIYNRYRNSKTGNEIKGLITDALRPVRYNNGRGFYFIYTLEGVEELYPVSPKTEGTNRYDLQDKNGVYVIRKEIEIVRNRGEGFSMNYWKAPGGAMTYSKASYVKHFKPFNWYIGSKEYREDFIGVVQKDVLERVAKIRFGEDGYIFIITFDGVMLLNEAEKDLVGKDISEGFGDSAALVVREGKIAAKQPGGVFLNYTWKKPTTGKTEPKVSFIMGVPDWEWMVGGGVYLDGIDDFIAEKRLALEQSVSRQVVRIIIVFLVIFGIVLMLTFFFSKKVQNQLEVFLSFFKDSVFRDREIDKGKLVSREFKMLADSANEMLARRRETERSLQESEERLAVTFRSIAEGVITTDAEGKIVLINRVAEQLTGWKKDEALGKPLKEVFRIEYEMLREPGENSVDTAVKTGRMVDLTGNTLLIARDDKERIISESAVPVHDSDSNIVGVVVAFRDITEKQRMEREAQRAQKLESLGLLAGGIAHDFNNLLTSILGNIGLVKLYTSTGKYDKIMKTTTRTEQAVVRTKNLTQQLLTFAREGKPVKETLCITSVLEESISFSLRGSNVKCESFLPGDLRTVEADGGQLSQVFNNLIINARQAMPEGGNIKIAAENIYLGRPDLSTPSKQPSTKDGIYVKISVEDFGIGISKKDLKKIFEPYYTTKKKGTGLGLASSFSIILKHNGFITVGSRVGEGSVFCVYLPASVKTVEKKEDPEGPPVPGSGKILVMDDDESLLQLVEDMLAFLGYEVETGRDGAAVIAVYKAAREAGKPFDAVMIDLTIPGGMGGEEAIKGLLQIDPDIKSIVSSGYSNSPVLSDYLSYGFKARIIKPYRIEELSRVLHAVLES